jgi:hypothetical protein
MDKTQRVSPKDCEEAWSIFANREKYLSLSDEEMVMVDAFIAAGEIKESTGEWPTLFQVEHRWMQEKEERERKRESLIAETVRARNAKQAKA